MNSVRRKTKMVANMDREMVTGSGSWSMRKANVTETSNKVASGIRVDSLRIWREPME
jgi:hypothetical protein